MAAVFDADVADVELSHRHLLAVLLLAEEIALDFGRDEQR